MVHNFKKYNQSNFFNKSLFFTMYWNCLKESKIMKKKKKFSKPFSIQILKLFNFLTKWKEITFLKKKKIMKLRMNWFLKKIKLRDISSKNFLCTPFNSPVDSSSPICISNCQIYNFEVTIVKLDSTLIQQIEKKAIYRLKLILNIETPLKNNKNWKLL